VTEDPISQARAAARRGEFVSAIALMRPLPEAGNREAQYQLGFLALTECDLISGREAFSLFRDAAEQGHPEAMYHLATFPEFLSEPFKSPLSEEEDWRWLLRAAESGCVQAQYDAAASLATGDRGESGAIQDLEAAVEWYRRAAEAGHAGPSTTSPPCSRKGTAAREIWLQRRSG